MLSKTEKAARKKIRAQFGDIADGKLRNAIRIAMGLPGDDDCGFKSVAEAKRWLSTNAYEEWLRTSGLDIRPY